jgi:hypothetical protein
MTIKTQGGKVITKDGKVSCECCEEECIDGPTSGQNVFEITKSEYTKYFKGGTWEVSTNLITSESADPDCIETGSGSGNVIEEAQGCIHVINGTADASATFIGQCSGDFSVDYNFPFGISVELSVDSSEIPKKYFVKYSAYSNVSNSDLESSPSGYPPTVNFTIDGNLLIAFGDWFPGWDGLPNYVNDSSVSLNATFTPN